MTFAPASMLPMLLREARAELVVGMPMRNAASTVLRSVASVLAQREVRGRLVLVVLDDASTDDSAAILESLRDHPRLLLVRGQWGAAWRVRNALLEAADATPTCRAVLRLDADDVLLHDRVLCQVERRLCTSRSVRAGVTSAAPLALLAGNALTAEGRPLARMNLADPGLVKKAGLGARLEGMADGDPLAELPSCNLVLRPGLGFRYAPTASAEDHWLTAQVLHRLGARVAVESDLVYCTYSLTGAITRSNRAAHRHREARRALLDAWKADWRGHARGA